LLRISQEAFFKRLQDLHQYTRNLGNHITDIHGQINRVEEEINTMKNAHKGIIEEQKRALAEVKNTIVPKTEINVLFKELNASLSGYLPPLTEKLPKRQEREQKPPKEREPKKTRFSFFLRK
jgi:chromosome segregation ATPase